MLGPYVIINLIGSIIIGWLVIKFREEIAGLLAYAPFLHRAHDAGNPLTYKIIGGLIIGYALIEPLVRQAISRFYE